MGNIGIRNLSGIGLADIDVYGTKSQQKTLSIKFKSHNIDKEKHILVFEVTTPVLKNANATIFVEEIDEFFSDKVLKNSLTLKSNSINIVTTSFNKNTNFTEFILDDGNTFKATISCNGFSAESAVFSLSNSKNKEDYKNVEKCLCKKQLGQPMI
jgi:hypothetical protein